MLNNVLHCVIFASRLVETQHDAKINSDRILAFSMRYVLASGRQNAPNFSDNALFSLVLSTDLYQVFGGRGLLTCLTLN